MSRLTLFDFVESHQLPEMQVGESMRVEHIGCGRKNASVTRTPVGWLMHCFKCGDRGLKVATHANANYNVRIPADRGLRAPPPPEMISIDTNAYDASLNSLGLYKYQGMKYGIEASVGPGIPRVWFPLHSLTRDIDGYMHATMDGYKAGKASDSTTAGVQKWYIQEPRTLPTHPSGELVYTPLMHKVSTTTVPSHKDLLLVEDPISALKIQEALDEQYGKPIPLVVAMLGLHVGPILLEIAGKIGGRVVLWADGDPPGMYRGRKLVEQLKFLRQDKPTTLHFITGKDPKHLAPKVLRRELDALFEKASSGPVYMEAMPAAHS